MELVLVDGRDIENPEHQAMLAALYSRSPRSVKLHMDQIRDKGADTFMSKWYVNYGHKSIGDCGTITIFAENVSMLCAKAIQDNPLYNGQEASTRYLDMSKRPCVDPANTPESWSIQSNWITLYENVLADLIPHFEQRFPLEPGQKKSVWKKAVNARAFDVARGFLPAGCTTFVAWHTNLRQAHDHLLQMRHNPCAEIKDVAHKIHAGLLAKYPSSFGHKRYKAQDAYLEESVGRFSFNRTNPVPFRWFSRINPDEIRRDGHWLLLAARPKKTELHQRFRQYGTITFEFPLDFGSYRDLQRQRSCVQEMPLLTTDHGFFPWYLEQLPKETLGLVQDTLTHLERKIAQLDLPDYEKQYYIAMGYTCPIKITCSLPSAVYIAELRSGTTVHPTLRAVAQKMGDVLVDLFPGIAMHHDKSAGVWDIKRGEQDIVART